MVVGAGMIGINAAIKLQQAGYSYQLIEAESDVGGTWLTNTYPGAAVDTESRIYSYSFEPNSAWSRYFPTGPELLTYLNKMVHKYGVRDKIAFQTCVSSVERSELWRSRRGLDDECRRIAACRDAGRPGQSAADPLSRRGTDPDGDGPLAHQRLRHSALCAPVRRDEGENRRPRADPSRAGSDLRRRGSRSGRPRRHPPVIQEIAMAGHFYISSPNVIADAKGRRFGVTTAR